MSSQALSLDIIRPTLDTNPRIRYTDWHASVFTFAKNLAQGLDPYGALCFVATPEEWTRLRQNLLTAAVPADPGSPEILAVTAVPVSATQPVAVIGVLGVAAVAATAAQSATYRPMTDWSHPTALGLGAGVTNTARDAYKVAYQKHVTFSEAHTTLTSALFTSIGEELTKKISDPDTGTFDLTPAVIVNEMFALYGAVSLTNADIDKLRTPLKVKLSLLTTFDSHCTTYQHAFAKLAKVG